MSIKYYVIFFSMCVSFVDGMEHAKERGSSSSSSHGEYDENAIEIGEIDKKLCSKSDIEKVLSVASLAKSKKTGKNDDILTVSEVQALSVQYEVAPEAMAPFIHNYCVKRGVNENKVSELVDDMLQSLKNNGEVNKTMKQLVFEDVNAEMHKKLKSKEKQSVSVLTRAEIDRQREKKTDVVMLGLLTEQIRDQKEANEHQKKTNERQAANAIRSLYIAGFSVAFAVLQVLSSFGIGLPQLFTSNTGNTCHCHCNCTF